MRSDGPRAAGLVTFSTIGAFVVVDTSTVLGDATEDVELCNVVGGVAVVIFVVVSSARINGIISRTTRNSSFMLLNRSECCIYGNA